MTDCRLDVLCIGNAIVDVISDTTDAFLDQEGLTKGSMRLIDAEEAERICSSSSALDGKCCAAPRNVFIVRWPSGVTSTIDRAVGWPKSCGSVVNSTPVAVRSCL